VKAQAKEKLRVDTHYLYALLLFILLPFFGCSRAESIPNVDLQTRLADESGLKFVPRDTQRESAGYWHFYANVSLVPLNIYVPEGSTFDQIRTLAIAQYRIEHPPTPSPTPTR
jgi:hypothetical protein